MRALVERYHRQSVLPLLTEKLSLIIRSSIVNLTERKIPNYNLLEATALFYFHDDNPLQSLTRTVSLPSPSIALALTFLHGRPLTIDQNPSTPSTVLEISSSARGEDKVVKLEGGDILSCPSPLLSVPLSIRASRASRISEWMTTAVSTSTVAVTTVVGVVVVTVMAGVSLQSDVSSRGPTP